jgi:hypothetical protein
MRPTTWNERAYVNVDIRMKHYIPVAEAIERVAEEKRAPIVKTMKESKNSKLQSFSLS